MAVVVFIVQARFSNFQPHDLVFFLVISFHVSGEMLVYCAEADLLVRDSEDIRISLHGGSVCLETCGSLDSIVNEWQFTVYCIFLICDFRDG